MSKIHVQELHHTTQEAAVENAQNFLDSISSQFGKLVSNIEQQWNPRGATFSFKVKKGILSGTVTGNVSVSPTHITINGEYPTWMATVYSPDRVQSIMIAELRKLFPPPAKQPAEPAAPATRRVIRRVEATTPAVTIVREPQAIRPRASAAKPAPAPASAPKPAPVPEPKLDPNATPFQRLDHSLAQLSRTMGALDAVVDNMKK